MKWKRPQRLEIRDPVGQGWSGTVYVAHDLDSPQQVAVRMISPELIPNVGRLVQILQPGATLGLPHMLPTSLPEAYEGQLFYAMPLADIGSLGSLLRGAQENSTTVDPLLALELTRQIGEGLAAAHTQGILHGNLKPENVLLWQTEGGGLSVQLSDFGLNSIRVPDALSPYLSAEQRVGAPPSVQDDLYGVGAMLFQMLTGRALSLAPEQQDLQGLPEPQRKLVARCLGWPAAFSDASSFLGHLRATQLATESSLSRQGVQLSADSSNLQLQPGTPQALQLRLRAGQDVTAQLIIEGWPPEWGERPGGLIALRAGSETVTSLHLEVPRSFSALPRTLELNVLALTTENGERELLARWPIGIEVLPFEDQHLSLVPVQQDVGRLAQLQVTLRNEGNQTQVYHLSVTTPAGSTLKSGSAQKQFELAPGAQYHDTLEVNLPPAWLSGRRSSVKVVAHARRNEGESWPPKQASIQARAELNQRPSLPWWAAALLLGGLVGGTIWAARPPQIESFALSGPAPVKGEPFTLAWKTSGARSVHIQEWPNESLTSEGHKQLPGLNSAQTYTLIARGLLTQRTQQVTVQPQLPIPQVTLFKITPEKPKVGQTVTVQWNVKNAEQVQLAPFGTVPASGSRQVVVGRDTRFELRAQQGKTPGGADVVSKQTVSLQAPQIQMFRVEPEQVRAGQPVTVRWQVSGASKVRLAPLGDLPAAGTRTFTPTQTGNLILKASNGQQEITASSALTVLEVQPKISEFAATPVNPTVGQPVTFRWKTEGSKSVTLRWGNQQQVLPPSGEITLTATPQMRNISLVAQGSAEPVLQSQQLDIQQPAASAPTATAPAQGTPNTTQPNTTQPKPAQTGTTPSPATSPAQAKVVVQGFKATPTRVATGGSTTLKWQVSGVDRVTLIAPDTRVIGRFAAQGSTSVKVGRTGAQTYRLVAGGQVAKTTVQVYDKTVAAAPKPTPAQSTSGQASAGKTPTPATVPVIQQFKAQPASVSAGERATLSWRVTGVSKVKIFGLRGPNADGSFPAVGSVQTPIINRTRLFTLSAGTRRATVRIPIGESASSRTTKYAPLAGTWNHSYGQMNLQVSGTRVTGTLNSNQPDLPSGSIRGSLAGDSDAATLNGYLTAGGQQIALLLRFDPAGQTFNGFYASRTNRTAWCGWRNQKPSNCK